MSRGYTQRAEPPLEGVAATSCNYSFAGQKVSEKREAFQKSTGDYFDKDIDKSRYTNKVFL